MVYKSGQIFLPFCHKPRVWQADGQTDRQTEISSLYRVCITCSAVKRVKIRRVSHLGISPRVAFQSSVSGSPRANQN